MPAMLKVLLGAMKVRLQAAASGDTVGKGWCLNCGKAISEWISSAITRMPWRWQISAKRIKVSFGHTTPPGLCGLLRINTLQRSSMIDSNCSKSIS